MIILSCSPLFPEFVFGVFFEVPVGTFFRDSTSQVVADLKKHEDFFVAARGGSGGKGNYFFMTNENRAPVTYEEGGRGEETLLFAELRVIAHFGMVLCYLLLMKLNVGEIFHFHHLFCVMHKLC